MKDSKRDIHENYTQDCDDMIWDTGYGEKELSESEILELINDPNIFLDFGEGLRRIIAKKMPDDYENDEKKCLQDGFKKNNIPFNHNTLKSWFDGNAPKKGSKDRENVFKISFALGLTLDETTELFTKVYCDRTFNLRDYKEYIYYWCIRNSWSYEQAQSLINKVEMPEEKNDETIYTRSILESADKIKEPGDVLNYIFNHGHNFDIKNRTAKRINQDLLYMVRGRKTEAVKILNRGKLDDNSSYIAKECAKHPELWETLKGIDSFTKESTSKSSKKSFFSVETMVDIIYGIDISSERRNSAFSSVKEGYKPGLIKNSNLPKALKGRFPLSQSFTKREPTSEELRKMIIILFSYCFWVNKDYYDIDPGPDEYIRELNGCLLESYLQKLYVGNPFDWLFLYCTIRERSLDTFRDIISECLITE
ncbi:MAG: hypothetical protein K6G45_02250 [Lachnospiraceae bacterium]|nr:hypothetical protein [Lachnospiraceae bacterium]